MQKININKVEYLQTQVNDENEFSKNFKINYSIQENDKEIETEFLKSNLTTR